MSAEAEARLQCALRAAREAKHQTLLAQATERERVIRFLDEARHQHWSWKRIGDALGMSDVAARGFYERNRRHVRASSLERPPRLAIT